VWKQTQEKTVTRMQDKTVNRSFENVAELKYLGRIVLNEKSIHQEIKRSLNSRNSLLPFGPEPFVFSSAV
jgi:hypothetical protein